MSETYTTQNELILGRLIEFYSKNNFENINNILTIINGESHISLRLIDWFVTNYAKKHLTQYVVKKKEQMLMFKVHREYKLKLRSYKKRRFDPFCRWERITIPYENNTTVQTTIGQLNFFEWALQNNIIDYIKENLSEIEKDMNKRNSTAKKKEPTERQNKTRKKRNELSISALKTVKRENVEIVVKFN
jgi:hypothetical protein